MSFIKITNEFKTEVILCTTGASIYDIKTLDYHGNIGSILVTPKTQTDFDFADSYFGKTIGRTGGRISDGDFEIDGVSYHINSPDPNGLHGGTDGLAMKTFDYKMVRNEEYTEVIFTYVSPDMESGYPGNLKLTVTYKLYQKENKLELTYDGVSDKDTLLNLSNHAYFNLNVDYGNDIKRHNLYINASKYQPVVKLIPQAPIEAKKIYSFKEMHKIGDYLHSEEIIKNTNGYDYPYVFDTPGIEYDNIVLSEDITKRKMTISTSYPVVVMYTCNYCEDIVVNSERKLMPYDAVCLECMYHPNTYKSDFLKDKKDLLKAGKQYKETIIYKFGLIEEE